MADLIDAESAPAARLAASQLSGSVRGARRRSTRALVGLMAHVQAAVDFAEDDVAPIGTEELERGMASAEAALARLLGTAARGPARARRDTHGDRRAAERGEVVAL